MSSSDRRVRSYSQLGQWSKCGEAYYLTRKAKVPNRPGWYMAGGTAVHGTIERYLREVALPAQGFNQR